jgi:hypothetical protein
LLLGVAVAAATAVGCNVSLTDGPGTNNVYGCDADSQCTTVNGNAYECRTVPDVGNVCVRESTPIEPTCKDPDNDGWGVDDPPRFPVSECRACDEGAYRGCENDCAPESPGVYPGYFDPCNGNDDNCTGEVDNYVMCDGPDFDDERLTIEDRHDLFCENFIGDQQNKSPENVPDDTEFACEENVVSGDPNSYCVPVDSGSASNCSSYYVCSSGTWSCSS